MTASNLGCSLVIGQGTSYAPAAHQPWQEATQQVPIDVPNTSLQHLLPIKVAAHAETLYPNHGYARGGVGVLLSTNARAGLTRLPQAEKAARRAASARLSETTGARLSSSQQARPSTVSGTSRRDHYLAYTATSSATAATASASDAAAGGDDGGERVAAAALKEWQRGSAKHLNNFVSTGRSMRIYDVPPASKWSSMSAYEVDPAEIKRHLDIMTALDQMHVQSKVEEREVERLRHQSWAAKQREVFRRQRSETNSKYAQIGLPQRPSYAWATGSATSSPPPGLASGQSSASSSPHHARADGFSQDASGAQAGENEPLARHSMSALLPATSNFASPSAGAAGGSDIYSQHNSSKPRRASYSLSEGQGSFTAVMAATGGSGSGLQPLVKPVQLPKPTFTKIYDRMGAEIENSLRLKEAQWRKAKEEAAARKEAADLDAQVKDLDGFEEHLRAVLRARNRSKYASHDANSQ